MKKQAKIRKAKIKDLHQVMELFEQLVLEEKFQYDNSIYLPFYKRFSENHFSKLISSENSICFVAEITDEMLVGYISGRVIKTPDFTHGHTMEISSIYVKEEFRNSRIGTGLVNMLISWTEKKGVRKLSVNTYIKNNGAIFFYNQFGFIPTRITLERVG